MLKKPLSQVKSSQAALPAQSADLLNRLLWRVLENSMCGLMSIAVAMFLSVVGRTEDQSMHIFRRRNTIAQDTRQCWRRCYWQCMMPPERTAWSAWHDFSAVARVACGVCHAHRCRMPRKKWNILFDVPHSAAIWRSPSQGRRDRQFDLPAVACVSSLKGCVSSPQVMTAKAPSCSAVSHKNNQGMQSFEL